MARAAKEEGETNQEKIRDIKKQIAELEKKLAVLYEAAAPSKLALAELGATFKTDPKLYWPGWDNPKLDSKAGVHTHQNLYNAEQKWQVDFPQGA
jgi:hypothetical protein